MSESSKPSYAGDVSAQAAWQALSGSDSATLVDVRTEAEWTYVGVPDLAEIGKSLALVAWDHFPSGELVPNFEGRLIAELGRRNIGREDSLYFICRSGQRSRKAAILATAAGYQACFNLEDGFEGKLGSDRHRATAGSWKAEGLPWTQT